MSQTTVLCIDDERMIRETVGDYLEDSGFNILKAENGTEGLKIIGEAELDIVLVDLNMPDVSGLKILEAMQKNNPEVPVIVISGTGEMRYVIEALRLGAWDYITKPIEDMEMLEYAINKCLERSRLLRENRQYKEHLEELVVERTSKLKESMELFSLFMNYLPIGVIIKDAQKKTLYANRYMKKKFNADQWIGKTPKDYLPEDKYWEIEEYDDKTLQSGHIKTTFRLTNKYDEERLYESHKFLIEQNNNNHLIGTIMWDITDARNAQKKIEDSLKEKDILLKEIHHRVKNNLQIIYGLLTVELMSINEINVIQLLQNTQHRIHAMSLIHKNISDAKDLKGIDFKKYIFELIENIRSAFKIYSEKLEVHLNIDDISLNIDTAVPCGLMLNEIFTLFLGKKNNDSVDKLSCTFIKEKGYMIEVSYNGDTDLTKTQDAEEPFGMNLIHVLAKQLGGEIQVNEDKESKIIIRFPKQLNVHF